MRTNCQLKIFSQISARPLRTIIVWLIFFFSPFGPWQNQELLMLSAVWSWLLSYCSFYCRALKFISSSNVETGLVFFPIHSLSNLPPISPNGTESRESLLQSVQDRRRGKNNGRGVVFWGLRDDCLHFADSQYGFFKALHWSKCSGLNHRIPPCTNFQSGSRSITLDRWRTRDTIRWLHCSPLAALLNQSNLLLLHLSPKRPCFILGNERTLYCLLTLIIEICGDGYEEKDSHPKDKIRA